MRLFIAVLLAAPWLDLEGQTRRPISHEDVWLMKRVGAPAPSPDGAWVVVPVTEPAYDPKDIVTDLWIVPTSAGGPPRRLTHTRSPENGVAWTPDSRAVVFSARRDGDDDAQIYFLNIAAGGEAQRMTQHAGGATAPKVSPDGQSLLYQADFDPIAEERKKRKYNARIYNAFPIRNWDKWLDERRPRLFVKKLDAAVGAADLLKDARLAATPAFDGVMESGSSDLQAIWAPDSASVVFVATTQRNDAAYSEVPTQIYQVSAKGGEPRKLAGGAHSYTRPYFRPDGKALYALEERTGPKVYSLSRIVMWNWPDPAQPLPVSSSLDRSVTSFAVTGDSRTLYALAEEHGHEKLFSMPAGGGGAPRLAFEMNSGTYVNLRIPARSSAPVLIANWESAVSPLEVVRIDLESKSHTALTRFHAERAGAIDWQPVRHFWFTGTSGRRIHNMIALPPGFDESAKYPLVVFIHGGPHTMSRDQFHTRWNYHLLASPGYVVLTTNYTGSTGFGEEFAQAIQGDPLKGPGQEINQAVEEAARQFRFIDASRVAAGGASYGGHLANWLEATTTRYKCLFSHAGLINLESQWGASDTIYHREINNGGPLWEQGAVWRDQNPIRHAARFKTPMFLTVGELDFRVPLSQTIENWSVLQRQRVPSRLIVFPDENHWILKGENNRLLFQELHTWLKRWL